MIRYSSAKRKFLSVTVLIVSLASIIPTTVSLSLEELNLEMVQLKRNNVSRLLLDIRLRCLTA